MRLPKTAMLGGHKITIRRVKGLIRDGFNGQANWDAKEIRIDADAHGAELGELLLHECIHMVSSAYGLELDEHVVRVLGVGLQQVLGLAPK